MLYAISSLEIPEHQQTSLHLNAWPFWSRYACPSKTLGWCQLVAASRNSSEAKVACCSNIRLLKRPFLVDTDGFRSLALDRGYKKLWVMAPHWGTKVLTHSQILKFRNACKGIIRHKHFRLTFPLTCMNDMVWGEALMLIEILKSLTSAISELLICCWPVRTISNEMLTTNTFNIILKTKINKSNLYMLCADCAGSRLL